MVPAILKHEAGYALLVACTAHAVQKCVCGGGLLVQQGVPLCALAKLTERVQELW